MIDIGFIRCVVTYECFVIYDKNIMEISFVINKEKFLSVGLCRTLIVLRKYRKILFLVRCCENDDNGYLLLTEISLTNVYFVVRLWS